MNSQDSEVDLEERVAALRRWRSGDQRAPHKPLLLLIALANVQQGGARMRPFLELEEPLRGLLEEFGPPRRSHQPRYPFWRLQTDGLWEVEGPAELHQVGASGDPPLDLMRQPTTRGGLPGTIDARLRRNAGLTDRLVMVVLERHFPPTLHEDLLTAVGYELGVQSLRATRRDPAFRVEVLRAYDYACSMCGFDGQLDTVSVGVEAAHVRWFAMEGPDTLENALALCALHHRLFDRGVLTADGDHRIAVSRSFRGGRAATDRVTALQHQPLRRPQPGLPRPDPHHLDWHRREVFRGPPRLEVLAAERR